MTNANIPPIPLSELTHRAVRLLAEHLGPSDTLRFFNQFTTGFGNYTEEREQLFQGLTLEDYLKSIRSAHREAGDK